MHDLHRQVRSLFGGRIRAASLTLSTSVTDKGSIGRNTDLLYWCACGQLAEKAIGDLSVVCGVVCDAGKPSRLQPSDDEAVTRVSYSVGIAITMVVDFNQPQCV